MHTAPNATLVGDGTDADDVDVEDILCFRAPLMYCAFQSVQVGLGESDKLLWLDKFGARGEEHGKIAFDLCEELETGGL